MCIPLNEFALPFSFLNQFFSFLRRCIIKSSPVYSEIAVFIYGEMNCDDDCRLRIIIVLTAVIVLRKPNLVKYILLRKIAKGT